MKDPTPEPIDPAEADVAMRRLSSLSREQVLRACRGFGEETWIGQAAMELAGQYRFPAQEDSRLEWPGYVVRAYYTPEGGPALEAWLAVYADMDGDIAVQAITGKPGEERRIGKSNMLDKPTAAPAPKPPTRRRSRARGHSSRRAAR